MLGNFWNVDIEQDNYTTSFISIYLASRLLPLQVDQCLLYDSAEWIAFEYFVEGFAVESQNVVLEDLPESESDFEIIKKESAECDLQVSIGNLYKTNVIFSNLFFHF